MSKERQFDGIRKLGAEKEELPSAVSTPLFQPFWFEKIASSTDFIRLLNQKERRLIRIWDHYVTISLKFRSIRIEMEKRRILPRSNDFVRILWISCKTVGERSSRSTRLIYKSNCEVNGEPFEFFPGHRFNRWSKSDFWFERNVSRLLVNSKCII